MRNEIVIKVETNNNFKKMARNKNLGFFPKES